MISGHVVPAGSCAIGLAAAVALRRRLEVVVVVVVVAADTGEALAAAATLGRSASSFASFNNASRRRIYSLDKARYDNANGLACSC